MIGRQDSVCYPSNLENDQAELYKRDIYTDMKIAIDCLKEFNDKLKTLHPDVFYKIRQLI